MPNSLSDLHALHAWEDNQITERCTQGEYAGKVLQFKLVDKDGAIDLTNCIVQYAVTRPDKTEDLLDCTVDNGVVKCNLTYSVTSISGLVHGEVRVIGSNNSGTIKFYGVNLRVYKGVSDEAVEQSDEFTALIAALQKVVSITPDPDSENTYVVRLDDSIVQNGLNPVASGVLYDYLQGNYRQISFAHENNESSYDDGGVYIDDATDITKMYYVKNSNWARVGILFCVQTSGYNYASQVKIDAFGNITVRVKTKESGEADYTWKSWSPIENTNNKISAITASNKTSTTLYPSIKAVADYAVNNYISKTPESVKTTNIEDGAITEVKLSQTLRNNADSFDSVTQALVRSIGEKASPTMITNDYQLNSAGGGISSSGYEIRRYPVIAGQLLYIHCANSDVGCKWVFKPQNMAVTTNNIGNTHPHGGTWVVSVPSEATYLFVSTTSDDVESAVSILQTNKIYELSNQIVNTGNTTSRANLSAGKYYHMRKGIAPQVVDNSNSVYTQNIIDLNDYLGGTLKIIMSSLNETTSARNFGFVDGNGNVVECWTENDSDIFSQLDDGSYVAFLKITGIGFLFSCQNSVDEIIIVPSKTKFYSRDDIDEMIGKRTAYVSTDGGSDNNNGSQNRPYATVNKALSSGADVILLSAGVYFQSIDIANSVATNIEIRNITPNGRVIFRNSDSFICSEAEKVSGYEKIYSCHSEKNYPATLKWLWQDNIPDTTTLISDIDRHPLQRGYEYRVHDTKILRCSNTNLADALLEIDGYIGYKWFYDSDNETLYFSSPESISSNYPICGDFGFNLFTNANRSKSIKLYGIETKYMRFNVDNFTGAEIYDCKSSCVYGGGAFTYNKGISGKFVRCEATGCQYDAVGDGFNGHATNNGDAFAKQTTVSLIDCWSHDNNDDGYSDHERSEISIFGGLFEYNGKAGVTPSFGSHCTCYDVISRNNFNGFYYTGEATIAEGGKYGQLLCFNCIALNNISEREYFGAGFKVTQNGNKVALVNCKSIGNVYGYLTDNDSFMELIDCSANGNTTLKNGNITILNTTLVT